MSPDWNGPDRNGPDWNSPDRNGQTESARLKSWLSDICWNQKSCNPGYDKTTKWKNVQIHTTDMYESYWNVFTHDIFLHTLIFGKELLHEAKKVVILHLSKQNQFSSSSTSWDMALTLEYFRSIFVTLTNMSGVLNPVFKNKKKYTVLQLKFITKTTLKM